MTGHFYRKNETILNQLDTSMKQILFSVTGQNFSCFDCRNKNVNRFHRCHRWDGESGDHYIDLCDRCIQSYWASVSPKEPLFDVFLVTATSGECTVSVYTMPTYHQNDGWVDVQKLKL